MADSRHSFATKKMLKLFAHTLSKSLVNCLKASKNIFYAASVLQLIFAFLLIFTPLLDNYANTAGNFIAIGLLSTVLAFLFMNLHELTQVLADKLEEEFFYMRHR